MSTFQVPILRIDDVYDHPNADRLSIVRVRGYECVAGKLEDGTHRFAKGEAIIYVPEGAVVPEVHLKARGYWNHDKDTGMLAGSRGNRVKAVALRGCVSQGLVWKIDDVPGAHPDLIVISADNGDTGYINRRKAQINDDVAEFFGITKYDPPIPAGMDGDVIGLHEAAFNFDVENVQNFPHLFTEDDIVTVCEKLHGSFVRLSYYPTMTPNPDLFGDGRVVIASKGLGSKGIVFKNTAQNREKNLYVRTMLPLIERFVAACEQDASGATVHLMGEVAGAGVQDLHYGNTKGEFYAFDVFIDGYLNEEEKDIAFIAFGVDRVPVLFEGNYDRDLIASFATGNTTVEGADNLLEGVVATATGDQTKRDTGNNDGSRLRPILKFINPAYLTRKGGTELQ